MEEPRSVIASRSSLSQQVRNHILAKIATGELAPGDKIVEARVAEELHVSTIPVREAIRELTAMRVLGHAVHKGARVREVTAAETVDALQVKAVLEGLAATLAGSRLEALATPLGDYVRALMASAHRRDWIEYQNQNQLFHRAIVAASGNQILLSLWDTLAFEVRTRFIMDYLNVVDPYELAREHADILAAVEARDAEGVAFLLRGHANRLVEYLRQQMGATGDPRTGEPGPSPRARQ